MYTYHDEKNLLDVIVVGAGAAGLMCALTAAQRGLSVVVLEKAAKTGKKISISGGGRCNFTNLYTTSENYLSKNSHFCKSALSRYTQWDFIQHLEDASLTWHEKHQGQLFCDQKANAVADLLTQQVIDAGGKIYLNTAVESIAFDDGYQLQTDQGLFQCKQLVIATGGASIPKMGATDFALQIAKQFGVKNIPFTPALVPFILEDSDKLKGCEGVAVPVTVCTGGQCFTDDMLITHKGLSGPAILQVSSFWRKGEPIEINFLPALDVKLFVETSNKRTPSEGFKPHLPKALLEKLLVPFDAKNLTEYSVVEKNKLINHLTSYRITPLSTEGMRTAEVCTGGVSTDELSSKTFESHRQAGLYFIGEAVDVTGWLGGYNFQWAWSSGYCCARALSS